MTETQDIDTMAEPPAGDALGLIEAWRAEIAARTSISASDVQDRLLDLWGSLEEGPARSEVEHWLTETLERSLYSVSDINERLGNLLATA